jgi:hypothetical protein
MGVRPGSRKGASSLYESFYAGEEGMQYFIKPLEFKDNNKNKLLVDFTFRYKKEIKDSVIVNISVISENLIREFNALKITTKDNIVSADTLNFFLSQIHNEDITSRFTTNIFLGDIVDIFESSDWVINIDTNYIKSEFYPTNKTKKIIKRLNQNLFILFRH